MKKTVLLSFILLTSISCFAQQTYYGVTAGNGNGVRFWNDDSYKIHMGNTNEYSFGPVQDYSIKTNMSVGTPARGWTWGPTGYTPVMALNTLGQMQLAASLYVGPHYSNSGIGRVSVSGSSGELSISNRQVLSIVESPTYGERWVIYNDGTPTDGKLRFWSGGDKAALTKEGNFGIGTSTPYAWSRLHAKSAGSNPWGILTEANGNDRVIALGHDGTSGVIATSYLNSAGWSPLEFRTQNITRMTVEENGNIGIGTITPTNKLQIGPNTPGWSGNDFVVGNSYGSLAIHSDPTDTYLYGNNDISIRPGNGQLAIYAKSDGNVGIGTTTPDSKLTVKGTIHTQEVKVDLNGSVAPDYVFEKDYRLTSLEELKSYIDQNKHLPEIPSAKEMEEEGINLKEMNLLLLKKLEELTLHLIEQSEELIELKTSNTDLIRRVDQLEHN